MSLLIQDARVLTMTGPRPRRDKALGDLGVIERADVLIDRGKIVQVAEGGTIEEGPGVTMEELFLSRIDELDWPRRLVKALRAERISDLGTLVMYSKEEVLRIPGLGEEDVAEIEDLLLYWDAKLGMEAADPELEGRHVIHAEGRVLMPAFVDCHTHACWTGTRVEEWQMRLGGAAYLDILKAGGGIMSTVRAVRKADRKELVAQLKDRLAQMLVCGSGTVEVKTGYGLDLETELKMLEAIAAAGTSDAGRNLPQVVATALLGHAIDPDTPDFARRTIEETLPAIHERYPKVPVDAYCEQGAWSLKETVQLLTAARELGHPVRVHADQFNALGMVREAVRLGAVSVDHLEASTPGDLDLLAESQTFGVVLPCSGLHLDGRYADARRVVDAGGLVALATNYNPGSAPCPSMAMAIALAVRFCGLTPAEAIAAATINSASVLGLSDRGVIAPGQRADVMLLRHTDERMLAFEFGGIHIDEMILGGSVVGGAVVDG